MKTSKIPTLASIFGAVLLSAVSAMAIPVIVEPESDVSFEIKEKQSVTLSTAVLSGGGSLQFSWYKVNTEEGGSDQYITNGQGYSGATTSALKITGAKAFHEGTYYMKVTENGDVENIQESFPFSVTVQVPPKIAVQPALPSPTPHKGDGVSLSVVLHSDSTLDGVSYQWQKNNVDISLLDNPTALSDTFVIPEADDTNPGVQGADNGKYRVKISSPLLTKPIFSKVITLTITTEPFVIKQPAADTGGKLYIAAKGSGKLSAIVGGTAKLVYQWEKQGAPDDPRAKATSLTIKAGPADEGSAMYRLKVSNPYTQPTVEEVPPTFTDYAEVIVLNKLTAGAVTANVAGNAKGEYLAGVDPLILSVNPSTDYTGDLEFQWQKDGKNIVDVPDEITGTNSKDLTFSPLSWLHRGTYRCIIMNKVGKITSKTFVLKVNSPPIVIPPFPTHMIIPAGGTAEFNFLAGGSAPLKYQWFKAVSEEPVSKIQSSPKFKISGKALTEANEGDYFCRITNVIDSITKTVGSLDTAPINLQVDVPVKISVHPVSSVELTSGGILNLSVTTSQGDGPILFQWQRNNKDIENGSGVLNATQVIDNPDPTGVTQTLTITALDGNTEGTYRCVVTNAGGKTKVISKTSRVKALLIPSIITDPLTQTVMQDSNATFTVKAVGTAPLKYQWQFKRQGDLSFVNLDKKTSSTLTVISVQPVAHEGEYRCVVSNKTGVDATSAAAVLTVTPIPPATITGITPKMAQAGDKIRVTGTNLNFVKSAQIGGVTAPVVKESATSLLLTVPGNAPLLASPVTVVTSGGTTNSTSPNLFTRSSTQVNDRNNPKIITGTAFPPTSGELTAGLDYYTGNLPPSGLGEAYYTWVAPGVGQYQVSTQATVYSFQINLAVITPTSTFSTIAWPNSSQTINFSTTTPNTPVTFVVYGIDGWAFPAFNNRDWGPYVVNCSFTAATTTGTGFNADEGIQGQTALAGQAGWSAEGDTASAQVMAVGENDQAVTFTGSSSEGTEPTVLWKDGSDVEAGPESVIHTEWTMSIDQAGEGSEGYFGWQVSAADGSPLGQLQFSVADGKIYLAQTDGTRTETEPYLTPGSQHRFEIATDFASDTWQARMDGVALGEPLPLPADAAFGDVSVIWYPAASGSAHPTMTFDNVSISVDANVAR